MNPEIDGSTFFLILLAVLYWCFRRSLDNIPPRDSNAAERAGSGTALARSEQTKASMKPHCDPDDNIGGEETTELGSEIAHGLSAIRQADRSFDVQSFLDGAGSAYEVIVTAFANGDRLVLQTLLSSDVFEAFVAVIAAREERGEHIESSFVSVAAPEIVEAGVRANAAQITLRFASLIVTETRTNAGEILNGNAKEIIEVKDLWTFARETSSRRRDWKLVATEAG